MFIGAPPTCCQQETKAETMPASTHWLLDASTVAQRHAIMSVYLLICPRANVKGTAFLLSNGIMVSNWHVVSGCSAEELIASSSSGREVKFAKMITDADRDLALLRPVTTLQGGLVLGNDGDPPLEKRVSTWGFPLMYNGPAPLLSIGYVAGYSEERAGNRTVKHLVINGAFNPGNSGGPLLEEPENKLIGIVVAKYHLYPPYVKETIETLAYKPRGGFNSGRFSIPQPDGTQKTLMDDQVIGLMLEEFYKTTQVMIGEAISIGELKEFLASKENELR